MRQGKKTNKPKPIYAAPILRFERQTTSKVSPVRQYTTAGRLSIFKIGAALLHNITGENGSCLRKDNV